jgi:hypothetical protein
MKEIRKNGQTGKETMQGRIDFIRKEETTRVKRLVLLLASGYTQILQGIKSDGISTFF